MEQGKETLLIVDDSRFQRAVLRELLKDFFDLIEVTSGEECLELIARGEEPIAMVLLDLVMPGIDGFEVLRRRQRMPKFRNIPVIILTTSQLNLFQTDAFELGADEFIVKPVDDRVALTRINNILVAKRRLQSLLQKQKELKTMTEIDAMTHLFNKTTSEHLVTKTLLISFNKQHALLVIDIDNFKAVNDIFGHKVGDHIITVVAGVISAQFRDTDYVGRIGGDEFIVFVRNIASKEEVRKQAAALVQAIQEKENLTIPENISLSIGLAFTDGSEQNYPALFHKADQALYLAKKEGKNCYFEYGAQAVSQRGAQTIVSWSMSRSVNSVLSFVYSHPISLELVTSIEEIRQKQAGAGGELLALYIDVSFLEDKGKALWEALGHAYGQRELPIIAICQEGDMEQVRYAVESGLIADLLFAPLDAEMVTRRARAMKLLD